MKPEGSSASSCWWAERKKAIFEKSDGFNKNINKERKKGLV